MSYELSNTGDGIPCDNGGVIFIGVSPHVVIFSRESPNFSHVTPFDQSGVDMTSTTCDVIVYLTWWHYTPRGTQRWGN